MSRSSAHRVLPGFGLSLGFTIAYLSLIVLIPMIAVFAKAATFTWPEFWSAVTSPRVVASYKLSFGTSLLAAAISERAEMKVIGGIETRPILVSG